MNLTIFTSLIKYLTLYCLRVYSITIHAIKHGPPTHLSRYHVSTIDLLRFRNQKKGKEGGIEGQKSVEVVGFAISEHTLILYKINIPTIILRGVICGKTQSRRFNYSLFTCQQSDFCRRRENTTQTQHYGLSIESQRYCHSLIILTNLYCIILCLRQIKPFSTTKLRCTLYITRIKYIDRFMYIKYRLKSTTELF